MCEIETAAPETPVLPPELFLLKLGEVVLKGLNRRSFEDKLVSNVRRRMKPCGSCQSYIRRRSWYVERQPAPCDLGAA